MSGANIARRARTIALLCALLVGARAAAQQDTAARDTLRLRDLQDDAVRNDPRGREVDLLAAQSALRLRSIETGRLPALSVNAQGQYQSAVPTIPFELPTGVTPPLPPHDTYDAHLDVRERIYDPALESRRAVERAQLAESQARVRSTLFTLRQSVNDAYFSALSLQDQQAEIESGIADLEAQVKVARDRIRLGAALPSEAAMLEAELLRRRQSASELAANRDAALAVLGDLTGDPITSGQALETPDLATRVAAARARFGEVRARREYEQFARSREVLARQQEEAAARNRPQLSAFGRAGFGRPGLNPLGRDFNSYWLAGVQLDWPVWNWGATERDRDVLALQQQIVAADEAAFSATVRRSVASELAAIDRLEQTPGEDDAIIALREQVLRETRARYAEGVITSAELVDRETDLLSARLARTAHRTALARARARYLTLIGLEVRP